MICSSRDSNNPVLLALPCRFLRQVWVNNFSVLQVLFAWIVKSPHNERGFCRMVARDITRAREGMGKSFHSVTCCRLPLLFCKVNCWKACWSWWWKWYYFQLLLIPPMFQLCSCIRLIYIIRTPITELSVPDSWRPWYRHVRHVQVCTRLSLWMRVNSVLSRISSIAAIRGWLNWRMWQVNQFGANSVPCRELY